MPDGSCTSSGTSSTTPVCTGRSWCRDLSTGEEIGIDPDVEFPIASLVKLPLAIAVLTLIADGRLDGATMIDVAPGQLTAPGRRGWADSATPRGSLSMTCST